LVASSEKGVDPTAAKLELGATMRHTLSEKSCAKIIVPNQ
jgi:hypothetical protein